jgi:hypothetical protein
LRRYGNFRIKFATLWRSATRTDAAPGRKKKLRKGAKIVAT